MNKIADIEKLNHSLIVQNHKLTLQVQVLTLQVQLYEKQISQTHQKDVSYQKLEDENITLKRDVMNLMEKFQVQEQEQLGVQDQKYIQQIEDMQKLHIRQINDLKKIYEDKIIFLQKEKAQLFDQTTQIGMQNQTSKNLEQQAAKIIQISHKLEKTLADLPTQSVSHGHIGISKDVYEQMVAQLKCSSSNKLIIDNEHQEEQFFSQRQQKKSSLDFRKIKQINGKKLVLFAKPADTSKTLGNNLTLSAIMNKRS